MRGMDAATGQPLDGIGHLSQSILDILRTPIGSRVMRRDYGSAVPRLLDSPAGGMQAIQIYAAVSEALAKWEPRFKLKTIRMEAAASGSAVFSMTGLYREDGREITLEGLTL